MKKLFLFLLVMLFAAAAQAEMLSLPLNEFTDQTKLEMRCMHGTQHITLPLAERWDVRKASLMLRYTSSNNLLGDISQMVVKINGEPIEQIKLTPQVPNAAIDIAIPVQHLKAGQNIIEFDVTQHYLRGQCEIFCAPDMWTNISLKTSTLHLEYELKPLPLKLGEATSLLFDPKQFPEAAVNIITENVTQDSITLATIVASGIARRFDYRKVKFFYANKIMPGMDNVLIGSASFAQHIAMPHEPAAVPVEAKGLKIFHLPAAAGGVDDKHALLAIIGDKSAELKVVAETLTSMTVPYPGTEVMRAHGFSMTGIVMYGGGQAITADKQYDFKTLNQPNHAFRGINSNPVSLTFRLPPDFLIKQNQQAKLSLNIAYGSGLRADSSISVIVNDEPFQSIKLDDVDGGTIEDRLLAIPTSLFKVGANKITFQPLFNIEGKQMCDALQDEGQFVTLLDSSTLYFPPMPHFVELPKIELFALNGFPFSRWPDGFEAMIYLPKQDNASIVTALNLIGMITQKNGFPLFSVLMRFEEPEQWDGELLVIGPAASIPPLIAAAAPIGLHGVANVSYPVARGWDGEGAMASTQQQGGLGAGMGVLMQFESPHKNGRSIVVLTAESETDLRHLGEAILEPSVQAMLQGGVALVDLTKPGYKVSSMASGKKYSTEGGGKIPYIHAYLYKHPYTLHALVAIILAALGLLISVILRRLWTKRVMNKE